jgi:hypothetical protein
MAGVVSKGRHMRKVFVIGCSLLGLVLVVGASTQDSAALDQPGTIRVTTRGIGQQFVDRGARGRGPGDLLVSRQLVYNRGLTSKPIGHADLVCTFTSSYARQCNGTFTLPRGKIVVAGTVTFRQFYELAVIGGTGLYDNVRGSLTVTMLSRKPTRELLLFRLVI